MVSVRRTTLAVVCLMLSAGAAPAQRRDTTPEPVLVELRLAHVASRTVQAYRVRSEVLVPLTQFLQLAEIRYRLSPAGRLEAIVDPGGRRLVVDVGEDTMRYADRRVRLEAEVRLLRGGGVYVGAGRVPGPRGAPLCAG